MVVNSIGAIAEKVKSKLVQYITGLILCAKKKSCTQMAKELDQSHDSLNRALSAEELLFCIPQALKSLIHRLSVKKKGWLIIDDTLISKLYAKYIEGVDDHFDSSIKRCIRGFSAVVIAWTNGKTTIPLDFEFWFNKEIVTPEQYLTKIQIAQILIKKMIGSIEFKGVILDGLYASNDMIKFLNSVGIRFEMRMHSNRIIVLEDGTKMALKKLPLLWMRRNQKSKTIRGFWRGIELYFTAESRVDKNGEKSVVFIVSNWEAQSSEHVRIYGMRWAIEMLFRTGKQSLGLQHCTARSLEKQKLHIYYVLYSYAFLQSKIDKKRLSNVESVINYFQDSNLSRFIGELLAFNQNFECFA